ncbi:E3 ubiquitin-protein like [Actinidia chinensis var. chinensis]|uniref:E3 ubiquitin-protein like n=1 Tax=Actinidia chinensis var. chinensis TaxID=1590841 RepID=A0A2R6QNQ9_ACTCC|nr:E3 ubiquitin-protein like [Actinidia chinensis var. chinensis]
MADTDTDSYTKPQKLENKIYTHFMYKATIFAIFLVIFPFLPSQAPEFNNQSLYTRIWELVQLLLVGIAVSYGLFSRRNDETEKEQSSKIDNAHSYMSRFLPVSSVFDDEAEKLSGSDENKIQTWNSQYYRGEPEVVLAQENSVLEEQRDSAFRVVEKTPLLPVRCLKSHVLETSVSETISESGGKGGSLGRSSSNSGGSKRFSNNSNKSRNGDLGGSRSPEEKPEENIVLRSPIPWKSRSGRMKILEGTTGVCSLEENEFPPLYSLPPSMEGNEFPPRESNSIRPQKSCPLRLNSTPPSSESQAKIVQEVARKKIYYKSPPPPPPPPPPQLQSQPQPLPLYSRKPSLVKSNSTLSNPRFFRERELTRSVRSIPKDLGGNDIGELRPRISSYGSLAGKSVQTISAREFEEEFEEKIVAESKKESESEDDFFDGESENEEVSSNVDKKADEFIAKFREQIRLQRIESIKRSTGQIAKNSLR